jgi:hypothetical protein
MMRVMILVALALPLSVSSQTVHQAPWMTGERLLALVAFPQPVSKSKLDIFLDEQRAKLYIHGVHDATEGKGWCFGITRHPKPDLLEQEAIDGIKGLAPPAQTQCSRSVGRDLAREESMRRRGAAMNRPPFALMHMHYPDNRSVTANELYMWIGHPIMPPNRLGKTPVQFA